MRKALILLLSFFALSLCGAAVAYTDALEPREEVVVTERLKAGDSSAAEGLSLTVHTSFRNNLFWDTYYTPGQPEATTSDYRASIKKDYGDLTTEPDGIYLSADTEGSFSSIDPDTVDPTELRGLEKAYYELWLETPVGEERERTVYVKDYMDYYAIGGEINIPGLNLNFEDFYRDEEFFSREAHELINGYFKIPVLENEKRYISIRKDENGQLRGLGGGSGDGESFYMWTTAVTLPDAVYFTINNRSNNETIVDTSLIPGGYGIYRLPYFASDGGSEVYLDELSTVKSLDEGFDIFFMLTDEAMEKLILIGKLQNSLRMLVIDAATMETVQDIEIVSEGNTGCWKYFDGGSFIVLFIDDDRTALIERQGGEYVLRFVIEDEADGKLYNRYDVKDMAWNGEKLAVSGFKALDDINEHYVADFYYAVFDETGLVCFVDCDSSLSLLEEDQWDCARGLDMEPMELRWN